jgi:diguanylate cyclase (GGDEF)-like protein
MEHVEEQSRLRSLASMARALNRSHPVPRLLELAAEEACRVMPAASCSISRTEPDGRSVRTLVNVGDLGPGEVRWPDNEVYPMPEFDGVDADDEDPVVWRWALDDPDTPDRERELLESLGKSCSICAPLVVDGRIWGEMWATRRPGEVRFDEDDAAYIEGLLAIVAAALSRADREQALSDLAYRDSLTGLLNRRAIDERARQVFEEPAAAGLDVVVVAVDINGLKLTNDRDGHQAGDRLLQRVARDLTEAFGELDDAVVARVGGDEFTVLVSGRPVADVLEVADRLVAESWRRDPETSLSCGAAHTHLTPADRVVPAELFARADGAQYVAKRERSRRVVVATPLDRVGSDGA